MKKTIVVLLVVLTATATAAYARRDEITPRCQARWEYNYEMLNYCIDEQLQANSNVMNWWRSRNRDNDIYQLCGSRWTDRYGINWVMLNYCIQEQEKSKRRLDRRR